MILALDIGNTSITFAILQRRRVKKVWSISTSRHQRILLVDLRKVIGQIKHNRFAIDCAIICSVVPKVEKLTKSILKKELKVMVHILGKDIKVPMTNRYRNPKQVGQDRLVGAYATKILFGKPAIVIDFGTAITFDIVSAKGEYQGGIIIPGIQLTADSLYKKTALLPRVHIERPKELIGRDTKNSILSGIFYGYGALCDGIVQLIKKQMKQRPVVIATGGYVPLMKKYAKQIQFIDKDLALKGIYLIYEANTKKDRRPMKSLIHQKA